MPFRHFDSLRIFAETARFGSFSAAAGHLNLTKGALSYQIRVLEQALGFDLFDRHARGVTLTVKGQDLSLTLHTAFDAVEARIDALRWGRGDWPGQPSQPLFRCPAFATGGPDAMALVEAEGLQTAIGLLTLLSDRRNSTAWADWHSAAGLTFHSKSDVLTIPDPNVRVQAVIDGQGIALNDALVTQELIDGKLVRLAPHTLDDYGYHLVCDENAPSHSNVQNFIDWIIAEADAEHP